MVDERDRGDLDADRNRGLRSPPESDRAGAVSSYNDKVLYNHFDVDSYAMMVYRANIQLGLADAPNEYETPPELRNLLFFKDRRSYSRSPDVNIRDVDC